MRLANVLRIAVRVVAGLALLIVGLPSLLLGILGLQDGLMDAGAGQNEAMGRDLLVIFTLTVLTSSTLFLLTRSPK
ncbi:MAG: hypothetical protein IAG10_12890 [Planctomycetaceae bacterium]|nr:hypothetical protein [Planctomycetaceae bacterium]